MFVFMMSLAGVPPLSGFVSKLLVIMGIVKVALLDVTVNSDLVFADIHWVWFLALLMVVNSAISVFYYLRVGLVMYFHEPEAGREGCPAQGCSGSVCNHGLSAYHPFSSVSGQAAHRTLRSSSQCTGRCMVTRNGPTACFG